MFRAFTFTGIPNHKIVFAFPYRDDIHATSCYFVAKRRIHADSYTYRPGWAILDHETQKMAFEFTGSESSEALAFGRCFESLANELSWEWGG